MCAPAIPQVISKTDAAKIKETTETPRNGIGVGMILVSTRVPAVHTQQHNLAPTMSQTTPTVTLHRSSRPSAPQTSLPHDAKAKVVARTPREALVFSAMRSPPSRGTRNKPADKPTTTTKLHSEMACTDMFGIQREHHSPPHPSPKSPIRLKKTKTAHASQNSLSSRLSSSQMNITPVCVKKKMRMHTLRVKSQEQPLTLDSTVPPSASSIMPSSAPANEANALSKLPTCQTPDSGKNFHGMMELPDDIWNDLVMSSADIVGFQIDPNSDDLEPIPYSALIAGAPVEVDDVSCAASRTVLSPFGMTQEEFLSAEAFKNVQQAQPISHSTRGKKLTLLQKPQSAPHQCRHTFTRIGASLTTTKPNRKRKKAETSRCSKRHFAQEAMDEATVGPDSWQMKALYRMIIYLEETEGCENAQRAKLFRSVVAQFKALHRTGNPKYLHLPGAIFEEMVDRIGGPAFLQIYNGAKAFEHPRLKESFPENEIVVVGPHATIRAIDVSDGQPNLLQVSVAYGFHLANTIADTTDRGASIKDVLERGAHDVLNLDETARKSLWASQIASNIQDPNEV